MAHFAKLDENNIVLEVLVVNNSDILDSQGNEKEEIGVDFLTTITGYGKWKQTSYNANFRKNYAGIGYTYDPIRDAFIPPKPYNSWLLNEEILQWYPPVPYPTDTGGKMYRWNEETVNWVEINAA